MATRITDIVSDSLLQKLRDSEPEILQSDKVLDSARTLLKSIEQVDFYEDFTEFFSDFKNIQTEDPEIFAHRTEYFWKWLQVAFQIATLRIPADKFVAANSLKCRSASIDIILDDICDNAQDEALFESCVEIFKTKTIKEDTSLLRIVHNQWLSVCQDMESAPNYARLQNDIDQGYEWLFDGFRHTFSILKGKSTLGWEEVIEKFPHTIHVYLGGLMDLLYFPDLPLAEIENYKKVFIATQKMAQIGNWISNWEREILQGDFTSPVMLFGFHRGLIRPEDIESDNVVQRVKDSKLEDYFLQEWHALRHQCHQICEKVNDPNPKDYVESFSIILHMQIAGGNRI